MNTKIDNRHINALADVDIDAPKIIQETTELQEWRKANSYQISCSKYPKVIKSKPRQLKPIKSFNSGPVDVHSRVHLEIQNVWPIRLALRSEYDPERNYVEYERVLTFRRSIRQDTQGSSIETTTSYLLVSDHIRRVGCKVSCTQRKTKKELINRIELCVGIGSRRRQTNKSEKTFMQQFSDWFERWFK